MLPHRITLRQFLHKRRHRNERHVRVKLINTKPTLQATHGPTIYALCTSTEHHKKRDVDVRFKSQRVHNNRRMDTFQVSHLTKRTNFRLQVARVRTGAVIGTRHSQEFSARVRTVLARTNNLMFDGEQFISTDLRIPNRMRTGDNHVVALTKVVAHVRHRH